MPAACTRQAALRPSNPFKKFNLPSGEFTWIPADLDLRLPGSASVAPELLHFLIFIAWDRKYLRLVEPPYRDFFSAVLPYLHVRSTDVHAAT